MPLRVGKESQRNIATLRAPERGKNGGLREQDNSDQDP